MRLFGITSTSLSSLGRTLRPAVIVFGLAGLAACSSDEGPALPYSERPVEDLYNDALDELQNGIYRVASVMFDEVERQHPYSQWARRSMLMSAYAHYLDQDYDLAILSSERFLSLHPGNANAPYAHYLIAVSYYEQISDVGRDQKITQLALARLVELVRRYPDTEYARDARLKIDLTRDHLAGKEMEIGRYYLNKQQHIAAINRFRVVVEQYETTTHVQEALHRLVEGYLSIGVVPEAQSAAAVLGYNYPGDRWYKDSYGLLRDANLSPELMESSWMRDLAKPRNVSPVGREILTGTGPSMQPVMQDNMSAPSAAPAPGPASGPTMDRQRPPSRSADEILFDRAPAPTPAPTPSPAPVAPKAAPAPVVPAPFVPAPAPIAPQPQPAPASDLTPAQPTQPVEQSPMRDGLGNWSPPPVPAPQDVPDADTNPADQEGPIDALDMLFGDPENRRPIAPPRFNEDGDAPAGSVNSEPLE